MSRTRHRRHGLPSRRMERTVVGAERKDHAGNMSPYVVGEGARMRCGGRRRLRAGAGPISGCAFVCHAGNVSPHVAVKCVRAVSGARVRSWVENRPACACALACPASNVSPPVAPKPVDAARNRRRRMRLRDTCMRQVPIGSRFVGRHAITASGRRSRFRSHVAHCPRSGRAIHRNACMNRPANMSPHVAATHLRAAQDRFGPRAAPPRSHAIASPTALPGTACPRSARPAHAFVALRIGTPRVTPRHLL